MVDQVVLSLAELELLDPRAPAGGEERRFCCPLEACAAKPRDGAHRSLSLNVRTGAWRCHRCGGRGVLRERWRPREQQQRAAARRAFGVNPVFRLFVVAIRRASAGSVNRLRPEAMSRTRLPGAT